MAKLWIIHEKSLQINMSPSGKIQYPVSWW